MKCAYCGRENAAGTRFCRCCGTRLDEACAPAPAAAPLTLSEPEDDAAESLPKNVLPDTPEQPAPVLDGDDFTWRPYRPEPSVPVSPPSLEPEDGVPAIQLPAGRGLGKMIFLGIVTLGIYPVVIWSRIVTELNIAASYHDGERTMPYFAMLLLTPLTLGIYTLVWFHGFSARIGRELARRELERHFGAQDFWLWDVLGILILVGPMVYTYRLMKAMNAINADYNISG